MWVSGSVGQWVNESGVVLGHECMIAWMHGCIDAIGFVILEIVIAIMVSISPFYCRCFTA
jgi:hypothetical protein